MKRSRQIDLAEVTGLFDAGLEVIEIGEIVGVLEGLAVEQAEVSARPLGAIRLILKVEWAGVVMSLFRVYPFNYA